MSPSIHIPYRVLPGVCRWLPFVNSVFITRTLPLITDTHLFILLHLTYPNFQYELVHQKFYLQYARRLSKKQLLHELTSTRSHTNEVKDTPSFQHPSLSVTSTSGPTPKIFLLWNLFLTFPLPSFMDPSGEFSVTCSEVKHLGEPSLLRRRRVYSRKLNVDCVRDRRTIEINTITTEEISFPLLTAKRF